MIWPRWTRWRLSISKRVERNLLVEAAARLGYASRGAVYLSIGVMALLAALRRAPHAEGAVDALRAWAQWPIGVLLLWVTGVGLCGFAFWRALQSLGDVERLGRGPKALATRVGKAVSGVLYGSLGITVLRLLDTLRDLRRGSDQADTEAMIQSVLALPFGRNLVVVLGGLLVAVGIGNMLRAVVDHFTDVLVSHPSWRAPIGLLARAGYLARGVAYLPAGYFLIAAGWHAHAREAVSVGTSLDWIATRSYGHALLAAQGLGLMAFGVFGLIKARYRRVGSPHGSKASP